MIRFLINPEGGRGKARRYLDRLRQLAAAASAELVVSTSPEDLTAQARRAVEEGAERLLVGGGDGTVNLALQGLAGSECALAVLPLGSGNDIAASLSAPPELEAAVEHGLRGPLGHIDLARIDGRYYAGVAGVGFDSAANETANKVKVSLGPLIYLYAVLHTLATFKAPHLTIDYEGGRFDERAMLVVAANGPRFGGGMRVAPQARLDDGLLDLVIVRAIPKTTFLRVFPKVYKGAHMGHPKVFHARTPWAHVRLDRPMTVYGDGERFTPVGEDGVRFEVVPSALAVVKG